MAMVPFESRCGPRGAETILGFSAGAGGGLAAGDYELREFYCDDQTCDCHRVLFRVVPRNVRGTIIASICYGWESADFYRSIAVPGLLSPEQLTCGTLDPPNEQSSIAHDILRVFQKVLRDPDLDRHLRGRYARFRAALKVN